jgi:hypothetical protein
MMGLATRRYGLMRQEVFPLSDFTIQGPLITDKLHTDRDRDRLHIRTPSAGPCSAAVGTLYFLLRLSHLTPLILTKRTLKLVPPRSNAR